MWDTLEKHCSTERLGRYLSKAAEDKVAAEFLYAANHRLSESLFPMLSILEVSLRNCVNDSLREKYSRSDWWISLTDEHFFRPSLEKIARAKKKIYMRGKAPSEARVKADQVVAEVSFNFWSDLFSEDLSPLAGLCR